MVTTCHDLNFATVNQINYLMRWQKKSMENADAIISISNHTKKEMVRLWDISPDKIFVIHHGVNRMGNFFMIEFCHILTSYMLVHVLVLKILIQF